MSKANFLWILSKDNTAPFIIVALTYFLFLFSPFVYFLYLKGKTFSNVIEVNEYYPPNDEYLIQENKNSDTIKNVTNTISKDASQNNIDRNTFVNENWKDDAESPQFVMITRIALFSAVLAFGAIGAAVSLITRVRSNQRIDNRINALELISVQTIGAIFACILCLFFVGDFIGGRLFPEPTLFYRIIYVHAAFAKLLVWSFIAGFCERFVPNMLNNLVKQADNEFNDSNKNVKEKEED